MSPSLSVCSQSGPPNCRGGGGGGGGGGGVVYHTSCGQYIIGVATFLFLPGLKLDEKSIENGFEGSLGRLFWGWLLPT